MIAWRSLGLAVSVLALSTGCTIQPLTPGPQSVALAGELASVAIEPTLPPAPVVQQAAALYTQVSIPGPTATPPLPTPIPYLTPTPLGDPALDAAAGGVPAQPLVVATSPPNVVQPTVPPALPTATDVVSNGAAPTDAAALPITDTPSAPPTAAPPAGPPPAGDAAAAEVYMVDLINQQRAAAGVAPLVMDPLLMSVARGRVDDMVTRGYTGHNDPATGEALGPKMIHAAGFTSTFVGENWSGTINPPPTNVEVAMNWFMTDPPHYRNILSPYYAYVGVGLAFNGRQWLIVQNFAGLN